MTYISQPGSRPPDESELLFAFAPLHKRAFGVAIGAVTALAVFLMTAVVLLRPREPQIPLEVLAAYFKGYSVSWAGAATGAVWGGVTGFVFGWFGAFCRNLALAISLFLIRTRAELARTRDFLDHV